MHEQRRDLQRRDLQQLARWIAQALLLSGCSLVAPLDDHARDAPAPKPDTLTAGAMGNGKAPMMTKPEAAPPDATPESEPETEPTPVDVDPCARQDATGCAPTLTDLEVSVGTLEPAFDPDVFQYQLTVPLLSETLALTPTAGAGTRIEIDGKVAASDATWQSPPLAYGASTIELVVRRSGSKTSQASKDERRFQVHIERGGGLLVKSPAASVTSMAMKDGLLALGACYAPDGGRVYVHTRQGADWPMIAELKSAAPDAEDFFGAKVAISGDTLVIGSYLESSAARGIDADPNDNTAPSSGGAFVYVREGETWSQQAYLKADHPDPGDSFGSIISLSGDTLAVVAGHEASSARGVNGDEMNDDAPDSGAVYVFVRADGQWTQQAFLKMSNADPGDAVTSVALSGDTLVVGAAAEDGRATGVGGDEMDNSAANAGAAYVFVRRQGKWSQQAYLKASNTEAGDAFGQAVAIAGDTLVVGAGGEDSAASQVDGEQSDNRAISSGAAYAFARSGESWHQTLYLKPHESVVNDEKLEVLSLAIDHDAIAATRWGGTNVRLFW